MKLIDIFNRFSPCSSVARDPALHLWMFPLQNIRPQSVSASPSDKHTQQEIDSETHIPKEM